MILTKASKLALYAVTEMAQRPDERVTANAVADDFGVSENHVAKVLQQLQRASLLVSARGSGGGYELARPAGEITMADVVRAIVGPIASNACDDCPLRRMDGACAEKATCAVHGLLSELSSHVYFTLESVTIATLARRRSAMRDVRRFRKETA